MAYYIYIMEGGSMGVADDPPTEIDRQQIADGTMGVLKTECKPTGYDPDFQEYGPLAEAMTGSGPNGEFHYVDYG